MDWIAFILILLAIGMVWIIITQLWMNTIDFIIVKIKRLLKLDKQSSIEKWHTLEEIKDKNQKN